MAVSNSLTLTEVSYSVANNTSEVRMLWTSTQTGQSHNLNRRTGYYVFNGTNGSVEYTLPSNTTVTIFDETFTVSHNSDGTGSVSASTWMDTRISAGEISKEAKITCGSKSISGASGTIKAVESGKFSFSATDSRGYTTSRIVTKTLINYVKLTCSIEAGAASTSGVAQLKVIGNYWDGNFGAARNTLTIQYRYKEQDDSFTSWINSSAAVTKSNNTYSTTISISGLDYTKAYTFQARAIDKLATIESGGQTRKTQPIFDWGVSDGVADFNVNGTLKINNVNIFDMIYPVDSIYISINNVNPSTLFGGTWERIKDTFLLAAGDTYAGGSTGGEATHALTTSEMPEHNHDGLYYSYIATKNLVTLNGGTVSYHIPWSSSDYAGDYGAGSGAKELITGTTGGGAAHNNMPPYLAVYIWKRTA